MKNIIMIFMFAAVLFAVSAAYAATSYEHCRCNQTAPGLADNTTTCCNDASNNSYQNNNKDTCCKTVKGSTYSWTGGTASWTSSYCAAAVCTAGAKQACGTCGMTTCNSAGTAWSACDETTQPIVRQDCNECGIQTRSAVCNPSTATWSTGQWGACTGYYIGKTICCDGNTYTETCKTMGAWNFLHACARNPQIAATGCVDQFIPKLDPYSLD